MRTSGVCVGVGVGKKKTFYGNSLKSRYIETIKYESSSPFWDWDHDEHDPLVSTDGPRLEPTHFAVARGMAMK